MANVVIEEIAVERARQINAEGWTPEHDDDHEDRSLVRAAVAYAFLASLDDELRHEHQFDVHCSPASTLAFLWPKSWAYRWWKPKDRRRDLIRAAALIVAEIERLDRKGVA